MTTKPFNLEEAKAGAKLVTRDGRPARIGIWDCKGALPLLGVVSDGGAEVVCRWSQLGSYYSAGSHGCDLLILCEPKLRAWKPEEVPVGALYRPKNGCGHSTVILTVICGTIQFLSWVLPGKLAFNDLDAAFRSGEHSTDGGKTWKSCGIEE